MTDGNELQIIRYSQDIDPTDIVAELEWREIKGVYIDLEKCLIRFPAAYRGAIEELLATASLPPDDYLN